MPGAFFIINIEITVFKSFKAIRTCSYNIFTSYKYFCVYQQHFSFDENKTKGNGEYALYIALFLIVLNIRLC